MEVKNRILSETVSLFKQYGIKSMTMDDIARHLSISKKTIYTFFKDKDALVLETMHTSIYCQECAIEEDLSSSKNAVHEIFVLKISMQKMLSTMNVSIMNDMQKYHPSAWKMYCQFKEEFILKKVINNINRGIKEGLYRDDIDVQLIARLRVETIDLTFNSIAFSPDKYTLTYLHNHFTDQFLYGIVSLKGYKLIDQYKKKIN